MAYLFEDAEPVTFCANQREQGSLEIWKALWATDQTRHLDCVMFFSTV